LYHPAVDQPRPLPPRRGDALLAFFALTYVVTWTFYIAAVALSGSRPLAPVCDLESARWSCSNLRAIVVALGSRRHRGAAGVRALLSRLFQWRVSARWYVFAFQLHGRDPSSPWRSSNRVVTGAWPGSASLRGTS